MARESVTKWIAALRSGNYKQTAGALCDGEAYCCLGVATELYMQEHPGELQRENGIADDADEKFVAYVWRDSDGIRRSFQTLPEPVRQWLGLQSVSGRIDQRSLASLNDDGASFAEIADLIESGPAGLFEDAR